MIFVVKVTSGQQIQLKTNTVKDFKASAYSRPVPLNAQDVEKIILDPRFYVNNLGFFCRQEIKLQAVTSLPLVFRLGSVQYCDRMEGKKNAGVLPAY
jgi:hypothetical protein